MAGTEGSPVVIVGAGVAGLSCARALAEGGRRALVLDRARGVGGRCATRALEGQPVDYGPVFLHGRDPAFLAALDAVPATRLDWPADVHGSGAPCQPEAFSPGEVRRAFAEGVNAFPRHLAEGLELRLQRKVVGLVPGDGTVALRLDDGSFLETEVAVLALAAEQADELLATVLPAPPAVAAARALLATASSHCALALLAAYGPAAPRPPWHVSYPETSRVVQVVSHESSKRPGSPLLVLALQAHPAWSRQHLEDPDWPRHVLDEAARLLGAWAADPRTAHPHRWRWARTDLAAELARPLLLALPGGARLGVAGDRFAPGGGVEAAWRSGRALAGRILAGEGA
ncbi:NAD(P)/FAD-dependent oxidoreductase [Anaeromyxobacter sp. Red801]|uniref:NAD(P)/FAD-dependent oxidoreductase n=1 Tax=Anaeromyxobacter sp. Red801 TaxID=3411632 RepID=UPI003BA23C0A